MARKADFNAEEWSTVTEAPVLAAAWVATAERGGKLREAMSVGRLYADARQRQDEELIDELVASPPSVAPQQGDSSDQLGDRAERELREAVEILSRHAEPGEVEAYRRFVSAVGETVARAHKEGGFIGIGGTEISDKEQAVLDRIAAATQGGG